MSRRDSLLRALDRAQAALAVLRGASVAAAAPGAPPAPTGVQAPPHRWFGPRSTTTRGVAKGLTPAKIASYLQQADDGDPAAFAELCQEITDRDAHVVSVLGTRYRAVANLAWRVVPASDDPLDRRIAEELTADLGRVANLRAALLDLLAAIFQGYAATEIEWGIDPSGRARPLRFHYRPAQWLRPSPENPEAWRVLDESDIVEGVPLEPRRWIVHTARAKPGWPVQAGLGRVIVWWYLFKNYGVKDWITHNEKFGSPLRLGKYPVGSDPDDIELLDEALRQLGVDASAVVPADMSVEFIGDAGGKSGADTHERLLVFANKEISKVVLGQTLTTEEGPKGAMALGVVHNDVRADLRDADALELAGTLTRDLLAPMVEFNYGPGVAVPRFEFDIQPVPDEKAEAEKQEARARVFTAARQLGIAVPVSQVREELGIRAPADGEAVLPPLPPAAPAPFRAPGSAAAAAPGCDDGCEHVTVAGAAAGAPGEVRAVLEYERVLEAYRRGVRAAWSRLVEQMRRELGETASVATVMARLPGVLEQLDVDIYAEQLAEASLHAEALGLVQTRAADREAAPELPASSPVRSRRAWAAAVGESESAWGARVELALERARRAVQFALLRTAQDVVAALAQRVDGTPAERGAAALDAAAEAPARTDAVLDGTASSAWGEGRWQGLTAGASRRPYLRYHTKGDQKVRPAHRVMEGKVYPADHPIWNVWRPPNGYGCRCWVTAHSAAEVEAAGWAVADGFPSLADGAPAVPDAGWQRHHGEASYDWGSFPESWRSALKVREERGG